MCVWPNVYGGKINVDIGADRCYNDCRFGQLRSLGRPTGHNTGDREMKFYSTQEILDQRASEVECAPDDVIEVIQDGQWVLLDRRTGRTYTREQYIQMCLEG